MFDLAVLYTVQKTYCCRYEWRRSPSTTMRTAPGTTSSRHAAASGARREQAYRRRTPTFLPLETRGSRPGTGRASLACCLWLSTAAATNGATAAVDSDDDANNDDGDDDGDNGDDHTFINEGGASADEAQPRWAEFLRSDAYIGV